MVPFRAFRFGRLAVRIPWQGMRRRLLRARLRHDDAIAAVGFALARGRACAHSPSAPPRRYVRGPEALPSPPR